ncbi:MAG: hypothetical protein CYG61_05520 [Actinobacteria bacterium]|nr:MAG: hypothetical protein CYG61_05520 [Actinomycetota bacterium]
MRAGLVASAGRLPRTLLEAVDAFEDDPLSHKVFPAGFVRSYVEMKREEWDDFHAEISATLNIPSGVVEGTPQTGGPQRDRCH